MLITADRPAVRRRWLWLGALGACQLAGLACAQQHCDLTSYPPSAPTDRYSLQDEGWVIDTVARLMWMRCSVGQTWSAGQCHGEPRLLDWAAAQQAARELNQNGSQFYTDWRLPQIRDLAMIAERQCENPRINLLVFPATPDAFYWTATLRPGDASGQTAMALSFGPQGLRSADKAMAFHVRLVRGAE